MTRTPKKFAKIESKNSLDAMAEHYRRHGAEERGHRDGMGDPQRCELIPLDIKDPVLQEYWTAGYRKAWAERKAVAK